MVLGTLEVPAARSKKILQIIDNGYVEWPSINAAARNFGVTSASISSACERKHKCCNYYWQYKI